MDVVSIRSEAQRTCLATAGRRGKGALTDVLTPVSIIRRHVRCVLRAVWSPAAPPAVTRSRCGRTSRPYTPSYSPSRQPRGRVQQAMRVPALAAGTLEHPQLAALTWRSSTAGGRRPREWVSRQAACITTFGPHSPGAVHREAQPEEREHRPLWHWLSTREQATLGPQALAPRDTAFP